MMDGWMEHRWIDARWTKDGWMDGWTEDRQIEYRWIEDRWMDGLNTDKLKTDGLTMAVRTEVLSLGPQGQRRPRAGVAKGGLDQKGSVRPTEVVEYEIP